MAEDIADKIRNPDGTLSGTNTGDASASELVRGNDTRLSNPRTALSHSHAVASTSTSGFLAAADKTKLNGIDPNATRNAPDADLRDRSTHTGVQAIGTVDGLQSQLDSKLVSNVSLVSFASLSNAGVPQRQSDGTWSMITEGVALASHSHPLATNAVHGFMPSTAVSKLSTVSVGATANASDAQLRDRSTHTGVQPLSSIDGIGTAASRNTGTQAGNLPTLDTTGKLPVGVIPPISTGRYWLGAASNQSEMLAFRGGPGDWCTRTDLARDYVIIQNTGENLSDWRGLSSSGSSVTSVNGLTGAVVLSTTQVLEGANQYFTLERVRAVDIATMSGAVPQSKVTDLVATLATKQTASANLTAIAGLSGSGVLERLANGNFTLSVYAALNHSHSLATQSVAGFLSASDKIKLDTLGTASALNSGSTAGCVPVLDSNGKLVSAVLPPQSVSSVYTVASQAAMLALSSAVRGDYAIRTDVNQTFILTATPSSTLANWTQLTSGSSVTSVNGLSGAVSLSSTNITEGSNQYFTTARVQAVSLASLSGDLPQSRVTGLLSDLANHTHASATASQAGFLSTGDKAKLDGIATGATANATNAQLRDRSTHTGTQPSTSITGLGSAAVRDVGSAPGNIPLLDSQGKIDVGILPSLALTDTFVVSSGSAMLSLSAQKGDIAVRSDLNQTFILTAEPPTNSANWQPLLSPSSSVSSVNGATGAVVLSSTNIPEGANLYFTASRVQALSLASLTGDLPQSRITGLQADLAAHTHPVASTTAAGFLSASDKTKLNGIASSATANASDADLRNRSTHTGTQPHTSISGLGTAATRNTGTLSGNVPLLDASGKIPSGLLPNDAVESVNGATGVVVLTTSTVPEGTNLYYTDARVQTNTLASLQGNLPQSRVTNLASDLNSKQSANSNLTALSAFASGASGFLQRTASNTFALFDGQLINSQDRSNLNSLASAAFRAIGTGLGNVPDLDVNGKLNPTVLPTLQTSSLPTIPISKGGTGASDRTSALNALLPSQSGNALRLLVTDGSNCSWGSGYRHVDVQAFAANGTWIKPPFALRVVCLLISGGGGGGSGQQSTVGSNAIGGNGGNAGGCVLLNLDPAQLGTSETVSVGTGGLGGGSRTSNGNGAHGIDGGTSSFAGFLVVGGVGGRGGGFTGASGIANGDNPSQSPNFGDAFVGLSSSQVGGVAGSAPTPLGYESRLRSTAGGAGGGFDAFNVAYSAGAGGAINFLGKFIPGAQPSGTRDGTVGHFFGTGGAGAQANFATNGGIGALYGGGGGGGAGRRETSYASSGGRGGDGYVLIVTECQVQ